MASPILRARGHNGQITLWPTKIEIARQGGLAVMTQGLKGAKEIPLRSIAAVQLKRCDIMTNGYLQITIAGGVESRSGLLAATRDENTVVFTRQQQAAFLDIKARLDEMLELLHAPVAHAAAPAPSLSVVEQLEKLAGLRVAGVLTDDEFELQKAAILGGAAPVAAEPAPEPADLVPVEPDVDDERSPSSRGVAIVLCLLLGWLGVHRLYTRHVGIALAQLLTLGGCGLWVVIDLMLLLTRTYTDARGRTL